MSTIQPGGPFFSSYIPPSAIQSAHWSIWAGICHFLFTSSLSPAHGIVLIASGVASFYFPAAFMYIIFGVAVGWAGITNLISGELVWMVIAVAEIYMAIQLFRSFAYYKTSEIWTTRNPNSKMLDEETTARFLTGAGCISVVLPVLFMCGLISIVALLVRQNPPIVDPWQYEFPTEMNLYAEYGGNIAESLAVLGFAGCLASFLSHSSYKKKIDEIWCSTRRNIPGSNSNT